MDKLAKKLNDILKSTNYDVFKMLSEMGKKLFFPKGILSQSEEAKKDAYDINATIGIAKENKDVMFLKILMNEIVNFKPIDAITYTSSFGLPLLRKLWKSDLYKKNLFLTNKKISTPIATCGITHGISVISDVWINENDSIILPDVAWGNYKMIFSVRKNAKLKRFSMIDNRGHFNLKGFSKVIDTESKISNKIIVLLNFPHNPSGYTLKEVEAIEIVKILTNISEMGVNVIAICDDAYFGLFYEELMFKESLFSMLCNAHKRLLAIKLDGVTKEIFAWGLRIGFITYGLFCEEGEKRIYKVLEHKTAGCIRGTVSNACHLSQVILLRSLKSSKINLDKISKFKVLMNRNKLVKKLLNNDKYMQKWSFLPFNSGYFMCLKLKTVNSNILRVYLLKKYGIGLISIDDNIIRVAYSCVHIGKLQKLFDSILRGIKSLEINL